MGHLRSSTIRDRRYEGIMASTTLADRTKHDYTKHPGDKYFVGGKQVPGLTPKEATDQGLITAPEFAALVDRDSAPIRNWIRRQGIREVAVIANPKFGHHRSCPPALYDFNKIVEAWETNPPRTRSK